jgi:hypothetical protein
MIEPFLLNVDAREKTMHHESERLISGIATCIERARLRRTDQLSAYALKCRAWLDVFSPIFDPCRNAKSIAMTSRCLQTCHAKRRVRDLAQT